MQTAPSEDVVLRVSAAPADWRVLRLAQALESGRIVVFSPGLVTPPSEEDQQFLREDVGNSTLSQKNISLHPQKNYLSGLDAPAAIRERTTGILAAQHKTVRAFLGQAIPEYANALIPQKSNFRPVQERGRPLSVRASNERLHVDAYASGPTHGDRVLRFFTNIHPTEARVWRTAGSLQQLLPRFAERVFAGHGGLKWSAVDHVRNGVAGALQAVGIEQAGLIGSSPYDRAMRRLHNAIKEDDTFQAEAAAQATLSFLPGESWMVMTDGVSHAAVSGQHALVHTFHVQLAASVLPQLSPHHVLAQAAAHG